jgi:hypothetical protein
MATTNAICGWGGSVTGSGGALEITNWEITLGVDTPEATSFTSAGWKERVPCLQFASGNFRSIGQYSSAGLHAEATFKSKSSGGMTIHGDIVISKIGIGTPVDGIISFVHDFVFTGAFSATY